MAYTVGKAQQFLCQPRSMFSNPSQNIPHFGIKPGMTVADFGSGSGAYVLACAQAVGTEGEVYAVDIQQELLESMVREAHKSGYHNIKPIWADLEKVGGTGIADRTVDVVLISNLLFQIEHKKALAEEALRIIHPYGKIIVIDWSDSFGNMGPHVDAVVTREDACTLFTNLGCELASEFNPGSHHYGLIFEKKDNSSAIH